MEAHHAAEVDQHEGCSEGAVDEGAVYDDVNFVEAIAEDCDTDSRGQADEHPSEHQIADDPRQVIRYREGQNRCGRVQKPLHLLALNSAGTAEAHDHGRDCPNTPDDKGNAQHAENGQFFDGSKALDPDGILDSVVDVLASQGVVEHPEDDYDKSSDARDHSDREPAAGRQAPVGEVEWQIYKGERDEHEPVPGVRPGAGIT